MTRAADGLKVTTRYLERALSTMKPQQRLYELVKAEMKRRARWKNANRGAEPPKQEPKL